MWWNVGKELGPDKRSTAIEIVDGFGPVQWANGEFTRRFRWTG